MPINKPTIAHQLKTVKSTKPKPSSVIHTNPNIIATTPHTRSHLRGGGPQWRKSSYDRKDDVIDAGDISNSDLKQCTRILRNVLANEENKSTSTDDSIYHDRFINTKLVGFKSPEISDSTCPERIQVTGDTVDEETEADSLSSIVEHKSILTNNIGPSQRSNHNKVSVSQPNFCTCQIDLTNYNPMHESKKLTASGDCARGTGDKPSVCVRCHNIIPQSNNFDKDCSHSTNNNKNFDLTSGYERFLDKQTPKSYLPNTTTEYMTPIHYDNIGDEKIDNLVGLLQMKVNEIGQIARATRDADLDRLVSEIDRAFQQMIRENALVFNHLKTITKTLKWDNSGLKQKIKTQSETNRDLKSEMKLLRQEHKQKTEELKLELQLKEEEIRQLAEKDKSSMSHWRDKFHNLEKEHEKMRCDFQAQILQACQKDTEIIQLKHSCTQSESKLKEQIHSLVLSHQNLQTELTKAQEVTKKYDQECQHNQSIIKAAREHVINLLDRHKHGRDASSTVSYRFDSLCDTPQNGSGDWINQATSLQQVLSMVSDGRDGHTTSSANYYPVPLKPYDQSQSLTLSPINFATTNYNNNYTSSSTCNPNISDSDLKQRKFPNAYPDDRSFSSRSPSEVSSTLSHNSLNYSQRNRKDNCQTNAEDKGYVVSADDSWHLDMPKAKMSSASSVLSTVSSLRSTDDREFRSGLQRLDGQISRLQTTLQAKLLCK